MSLAFIIVPPVGKSAARYISFLPAILSLIACATSIKLCGAHEHAIATPIPLFGLHNKLGKIEGNSIGSSNVSE